MELSLSLSDAVLVMTTFFVASFALQWITWRVKKLPPGPIGLPVVGYLPFLGKDPHLTLDRLRFKYGPVFSLHLGSQFVVVLGNPKVIKEAFSQDAFSDRPHNGGLSFRDDATGFVEVSGPEWREQRKFALHVLRDLGFGKKKMEDHINEEITEFTKCLKQRKGSPFDPSVLLTASVANNIYALVYGERLDYDDPKKVANDVRNDQMAVYFQQTAFHAFFPWLKKFMLRFRLFSFSKLDKLLDQDVEFMSAEVATHRETLDVNNPRDYIDRYLIEKEARDSKSQNHSFSNAMLLGNIALLFGAGSETVRNSIRWALLLMASHPNIQTRVQREIDSTVGSEKRPMWSDHPRLPFVQAVLMEVQRWVTLAPINLPRCTNVDSVINGYNIPRGTVVLANLWGAHHDPETWKAPHLFRPERFFDNENRLVKSDALMGFSFGKRSCPGEALANVEVFLYFVSILQQFTVKHPASSGKPDLRGVLGITLQPKPQELCFVERT